MCDPLYRVRCGTARREKVRQRSQFVLYIQQTSMEANPFWLAAGQLLQGAARAGASWAFAPRSTLNQYSIGQTATREEVRDRHTWKPLRQTGETISLTKTPAESISSYRRVIKNLRQDRINAWK